MTQQRGFPAGTVRLWRGIPFRKKADGKWAPVRGQKKAGPVPGETHEQKMLRMDRDIRFLNAARDLKARERVEAPREAHEGRMLVMTTPNKGAKKVVEAGAKGVAYFIQPNTHSGIKELVTGDVPWAADNAAFSNWQPERFDEMVQTIARELGNTGYKNPPLFVVVPDVPFNHNATLERFWEYADDLGDSRYGLGLPLAFAVQEGSELVYKQTSREDAGDVTDGIPWDHIAAILVGGTTEWKLSDAAQEIIREAKARGKWVHVGRVNSSTRSDKVARMGADSYDGSSTSMFPDAHLPDRQVDVTRERARQFPLEPEAPPVRVGGPKPKRGPVRVKQIPLFKAKVPVGTVHTWADGPHRKKADGDWEDVSEGGWETFKRQAQPATQLDLFGILQAGVEEKPAHDDVRAGKVPVERSNYEWTLPRDEAKPWTDPAWAPDLSKYDRVVINASGGKDSQAMMGRVVRAMKEQNIDLDRAVVVHADLGENVAWKGEMEMARAHAAHYGLQFEVVQRDQGDLLDAVVDRYDTMIQREADVAGLQARGVSTWADLAKLDQGALAGELGSGDAKLRAALSGARERAGKLIRSAAQKVKEGAGADPIGFGEPIAWPSSAARFCTSDHKRAPIQKFLTQLGEEVNRDCRILNCMGLRAQESSERAKKAGLSPNEGASTSTRKDGTRLRHVDDWNPILSWPLEAVWDANDSSGVAHHYAYDIGMPRLSCLFCVFQPEHVMALSAQHNPEQFAKWVATEQRVRHSIKQGMSLVDLQAKLRDIPEGLGLEGLEAVFKQDREDRKDKKKRIKKSRVAESPTEQGVKPSELLFRLARAAGRVKPVAIRVHRRPGGGLCVHLDTADRSQHVGWAEPHDAPGVSVAAGAVAQVLGIPLVEEGEGVTGEGELSKAQQFDLFGDTKGDPEGRAANADRIVTLNSGLGRDSTTMLILLSRGELKIEGRKTPLGLADVDAVVFSDTGVEWDHTLALIEPTRKLAGDKFIVLEKEGTHPKEDYAQPPKTLDDIRKKARSGGYHIRPSVLDDSESRATVVSMSRGDCTENHKILPIRRFIADLARLRFGVDSNREWGVATQKGFRPQHMTMVGIAADEQSRLEGHAPGPSYVTESYPLVHMGIKKTDEQPILASAGMGHTRKSGCKICPYQPPGWYWALDQTDPAGFAKVEAYERKSLAKNPNMNIVAAKIKGADGKPRAIRIGEVVTRWRQKNPHATVSAVLNKEYSREFKQAKADIKAELAGITGAGGEVWPPTGPGWQAIPEGHHGGMRRKGADGEWEYRYPPTHQKALLVPGSLVKARGKKDLPGTVRTWSDGLQYRKQADGKWLPLAAAGQASLFDLRPVELSPEEDYKKNGTRSEAFKRWFGDWTAAKPFHVSKVVDADGKPKVVHSLPKPKLQPEHKLAWRKDYLAPFASVTVRDTGPVVAYHGTPAGDFDWFDPSRANPGLLYGPGLYFTESKDVAEGYTLTQTPKREWIPELADPTTRRANLRAKLDGMMQNPDFHMWVERKRSGSYSFFADLHNLMLDYDARSDGDRQLKDLLFGSPYGIEEFKKPKGGKKVFAVYLNVRTPFDGDDGKVYLADLRRAAAGTAGSEGMQVAAGLLALCNKRPQNVMMDALSRAFIPGTRQLQSVESLDVMSADDWRIIVGDRVADVYEKMTRKSGSTKLTLNDLTDIFIRATLDKKEQEDAQDVATAFAAIFSRRNYTTNAWRSLREQFHTGELVAAAETLRETKSDKLPPERHAHFVESYIQLVKDALAPDGTPGQADAARSLEMSDPDFRRNLAFSAYKSLHKLKGVNARAQAELLEKGDLAKLVAADIAAGRSVYAETPGLTTARKEEKHLSSAYLRVREGKAEDGDLFGTLLPPNEVKSAFVRGATYAEMLEKRHLLQLDKTKINRVLTAAGYDGITHTGGLRTGNRDKLHRVWIAFRADQVKAVENSGTFDPNERSIYKARGKKEPVGAVHTWADGIQYRKDAKGWTPIGSAGQGSLLDFLHRQQAAPEHKAAPVTVPKADRPAWVSGKGSAATFRGTRVESPAIVTSIPDDAGKQIEGTVRKLVAYLAASPTDDVYAARWAAASDKFMEDGRFNSTFDAAEAAYKDTMATIEQEKRALASKRHDAATSAAEALRKVAKRMLFGSEADAEYAPAVRKMQQADKTKYDAFAALASFLDDLRQLDKTELSRDLPYVRGEPQEAPILPTSADHEKAARRVKRALSPMLKKLHEGIDEAVREKAQVVGVDHATVDGVQVVVHHASSGGWHGKVLPSVMHNAEKNAEHAIAVDVPAAAAKLRATGFGNVLRNLEVHVTFAPRVDIGGLYKPTEAPKAVWLYAWGMGPAHVDKDSSIRKSPSERVLLHEIGHRIFGEYLSPGEQRQWREGIEAGFDVRNMSPPVVKFSAWVAAHVSAKAPTPGRSEHSPEHKRELTDAIRESKDLSPGERWAFRQFVDYVYPSDIAQAVEAPEKLRESVLYGISVEPGGHKYKEWISRYARANPEEAFSEALALYVGDGPRAIGPETRALFLRVTERVRSMQKSGDPVDVLHVLSVPSMRGSRPTD